MSNIPYWSAWLAVGLAIIGMITGALATSDGDPLYLASGLSTLASWVLLPTAAYFDIRHVRETSWWQPDGPPWVVNFAVPFWGPLMWALFSFFRHERIGELSPPPSALPKARQPDPQPRQPRQQQQPRQSRQQQQRRSQRAQQQAQTQTDRRKARRGK